MTAIQPYDLSSKLDDEIIKQLRLADLAAGHPFLYHSNLLPDGQVFFEYPNGSFQVETRTGTGTFQVIRPATIQEITALKQE
ncbi:hypothetical protein [Cnuella takakiae]|uniref:hypothetical protein n=1 Tax=Cnuella takakiae TaxID=1302690 RepID=UPI0009321E00|nr:hypothetical protein [Cnuella takakiae]OLY94563.1 hypothetical protein BUE76_23850 [Cnuella takakiae]